MTGRAGVAAGLALLIFLLEPLISLYWVLTGLIVWALVRTGLRAILDGWGQIRARARPGRGPGRPPG